MILRTFTIVALFLLASCGFEPVYGTRGKTSSVLLPGDIKVMPITGGHEEQLLQIALEDALNPIGASTTQASWQLVVTLEKTQTPIAIEPDGTISRYNLNLAAHLQLSPAGAAEAAYTDHVRRISSYNVSESDFSSFIAQRDATERGIKELAQDVRLRLAAWLAKRVSKDVEK